MLSDANSGASSEKLGAVWYKPNALRSEKIIIWVRFVIKIEVPIVNESIIHSVENEWRRGAV